MNRRDWFKVVTASIPIPFLANAERLMAAEPPKQERVIQDIMPGFYPTEFFDVVKIEAGQTTEFPIDFVLPKNTTPSAYVIPNHAREACIANPYPGRDYDVWIPTYDIGAADDGQDGRLVLSNVITALHNKLKLDASHILFTAGEQNPIIQAETSEKSLRKTWLRFRKIYSPDKIDLKSFSYNGYTVTVNRKAGSCVMPVRVEPEVHVDPTLKNGLYGWMEFGLAVLKSEAVLLGKIG